MLTIRAKDLEAVLGKEWLQSPSWKPRLPNDATSIVLPLDHIIRDIAWAIAAVDARRPVARSARTEAIYQPGIGPHTEAKTLELVITELKSRTPEIYTDARLGIPYPAMPRQRCDLFIPAPRGNWHLEVKLFRLIGDNGKPNDNMLMHILSPYPQHRSAVTDCQKLLQSGFRGRLGILIYGYEHPDWPMHVALNAFERLASGSAALSSPAIARFQELVHPIHKSGIVAGWELLFPRPTQPRCSPRQPPLQR
jgi:hypothetical protein